MARIARIGILRIGFYIGLIAIFCRPPTRTHLPAEEEHNPDQERDAHDQRRRERLQIGEHAGLLPELKFVPWRSLFAL